MSASREAASQEAMNLSRAEELLADEAVWGLGWAESAELDEIVSGNGTERIASELTAGLVAASCVVDGSSLPAGLRERLAESAVAFEATEAVVGVIGPGSHAGSNAGSVAGTSGMATAGWFAAAAAIVLAFVAWFGQPSQATDAPLSSFDAFASTHDDAQTGSWTDWMGGDAPEIAGVTGEVIWSESRGSGLMKFVGLPVNDSSEVQYQLWIIDERGLTDDNGQSARISGGVFDVTETGEVIVPIEAALDVRNAAAFAITIEEPGGVWASDMSRRVVIASLDNG